MTQEPTGPSPATPPAGSGAVSSTSGTRLTDRIPETPPRVRELFARRPTVGAGPAAQAVATDISDLVKAEVALAKSELQQKATEKGLGVGLFLGAAVMGWLGLQGVLITIGFVLAIWLQAWAAALIVTAVLLLVAGILAFVGNKKFATPLGLDAAKQNVREDIDHAKAHLNGPNTA